MVLPQEKLAESLSKLRALQSRGVAAVRSGALPRTHRERLVKNGFLREVLRGWYIPVRPDEAAGESTAWYASFWGFCASYLNARFGDNWCLSPEQSLSLHAGNRTVPRQLLVRSPRAGNSITKLLHGTSLFDTRAALPQPGQVLEKDGLRLFSIPAGLVACRPGFFQHASLDARAVLAAVHDASEVLSLLLGGGRSVVSGRLAGAFRNIGKDRIADEILKTMQTTGYDVREKDPFEQVPSLILPPYHQSPAANRIRMMWQQMRPPIMDHFPSPPGKLPDTAAYLKAVDKHYVQDAYHSLSIEGYQVSPSLIERIRQGNWQPDENQDDRDQANALSARGYWQAYQAIRKSVTRVLNGENPGVVCHEDHNVWYREMFIPGVSAGLLRATDLAGYRNSQVYIRRSMHVPPRTEAVRDCMPVFFDMLKDEPGPGVRVVLGHFVFVYIHPYMDGNGRIARFLMNVMLAAAGYPWTIVPVEKRDIYMDALEKASVDQDITAFASFLGQLVSANIFP